MGGYCDAPWDASLKQLPPNKNYLFSTVRNDGNIGSDYAPGMELSFDKDAYPYLTAELGGGVQVTHHRRPRVAAEDIGAMADVLLHAQLTAEGGDALDPAALNGGDQRRMGVKCPVAANFTLEAQPLTVGGQQQLDGRTVKADAMVETLYAVLGVNALNDHHAH